MPNENEFKNWVADALRFEFNRPDSPSRNTLAHEAQRGVGLALAHPDQFPEFNEAFEAAVKRALGK